MKFCPVAGKKSEESTDPTVNNENTVLHTEPVPSTPAPAIAQNHGDFQKRVCPVAHNNQTSTQSSAGSHGDFQKRTCPVAHGRSGAQSGGKSVFGRRRNFSEPPDSDAVHYVKPYVASDEKNNRVLEPGLIAEGEVVSDDKIPSSGRGNSDDGQHWVNPSPNQLYRALLRNDKPIGTNDVFDVSMVHDMVTLNSWWAVMEYEDMHKDECPNPTLARFEGKDGIYSFKAKVIKAMTGVVPFDRHDWYIDRCGKEIKYIIDYYSIEVPREKDAEEGEADNTNAQVPHAGEGEGEGEGGDDDDDTETAYSIDARPAPTFLGMKDRFAMAFQKWRQGEQWW